jgi:hypothetical protein
MHASKGLTSWCGDPTVAPPPLLPTSAVPPLNLPAQCRTVRATRWVGVDGGGSGGGSAPPALP